MTRNALSIEAVGRNQSINNHLIWRANNVLLPHSIQAGMRISRPCSAEGHRLYNDQSN